MLASVRLKQAAAAVDKVVMASSARKLPALKPDRVTIWPADDDHFGADVLYLGRGAYQRAVQVDRELTESGLATTFRQDADGAWAVRLGPLERRVMLMIIDQVVGRAPRRRAATQRRQPARAR